MNLTKDMDARNLVNPSNKYVRKLKAVRKMHNESQIVFGERIGYTQSWLSQMERGVKPIPLSLKLLIDYMIKDYENT